MGPGCYLYSFKTITIITSIFLITKVEGAKMLNKGQTKHSFFVFTNENQLLLPSVFFLDISNCR